MAIFKRRNPLAWHHHLKEWVWPSAGWKRMSKYVMFRVVRIQDSSYSIAAGLACGAAISFTPLIGLHLALSMGIAWAIRANVVAAAIGTLIGNPWTFPFIWVSTYETGVLMLGGDHTIDITAFMQELNIFHHPYDSLKPVLLPLLLGSLPYIFFSWIAVYFPSKRFIEVRQGLLKKKRDQARRRRKRKGPAS